MFWSLIYLFSNGTLAAYRCTSSFNRLVFCWKIDSNVHRCKGNRYYYVTFFQNESFQSLNKQN
jgi:hypothetical protein